MANGIVHERKHDQAWHLNVEQRVVHAPFDAQAVPEPDLLDFHVLPGQVQFRPQAQGLSRRVVEHRAQQGGQADEQPVSRPWIAMEQRRYRLKRVEEEMGMKLALQEREAGLAELTREAPGLDLLLLPGLRMLHGRRREEDQEVDERDAEEGADQVHGGRHERRELGQIPPRLAALPDQADGAQRDPVRDEDQDHAEHVRAEKAPCAESFALDAPVEGEDHRGEKGPRYQASHLGHDQLLPGEARQQSLENPGQGQASEDQETESQAVP